MDSALEGYNGTIFAYGQTGSGKTYTMMGNNNISIKETNANTNNNNTNYNKTRTSSGNVPLMNSNPPSVTSKQDIPFKKDNFNCSVNANNSCNSMCKSPRSRSPF